MRRARERCPAARTRPRRPLLALGRLRRLHGGTAGLRRGGRPALGDRSGRRPPRRFACCRLTSAVAALCFACRAGTPSTMTESAVIAPVGELDLDSIGALCSAARRRGRGRLPAPGSGSVGGDVGGLRRVWRHHAGPAPLQRAGADAGGGRAQRQRRGSDSRAHGVAIAFLGVLVARCRIGMSGLPRRGRTSAPARQRAHRLRGLATRRWRTCSTSCCAARGWVALGVDRAGHSGTAPEPARAMARAGRGARLDDAFQPKDGPVVTGCCRRRRTGRCCRTSPGRGTPCSRR